MIALLRLNDVLKRLGCSRSLLYKMIDECLFPPPVSLGRHFVAWPDYEVDSVVKAIIAGNSHEQLKGKVQKMVKERQSIDI